MTQKITARLCVDTFMVWMSVLNSAQEDEGITVSKYISLQKKYHEEMIQLFHELTWQDQIDATVVTHCTVWERMLDEEQLAAYLIMRD